MKRYATILRPLLFVMALGFISPIASAQTSDPTGWQPGPVPDADSAIKIALAFTGFDKTEEFSLDMVQAPRRIQAEQDTSQALLHEMINGRAAWSVVFDDVSIGRRVSQDESLDQDRWTVEVMVDAETGALLKIVSTSYSLADTNILKNPWASIMLRLPHRAAESRELKPVGVPTSDSFRNAIVSSNECGWVSSPMEIEAYYLLFVPTSDSPSAPSDAGSEWPVWYMLLKDVSIHPYRPDFGVVPVIAYWCFNVVTQMPGGCGGFSSGKLDSSSRSGSE